MGGEVRKQAEPAPVRLIAQAPADSELAATRSRSFRASSTKEPRSGRRLEHALGLGENRAGGARFAQGEMRAGELETDLDGHPRKTMIELRPQTVGARQRRSRLPVSGLVEGDPCRRSMDDCRVAAETFASTIACAARARSAASPQAPCLVARSASSA